MGRENVQTSGHNDRNALSLVSSNFPVGLFWSDISTQNALFGKAPSGNRPTHTRSAPNVPMTIRPGVISPQLRSRRHYADELSTPPKRGVEPPQGDAERL